MERPPNGALVHAVKALAPTVCVSMAGSVAGLVVVRGFVPSAVLRESNDVVGNYLQTLGTIFAVLLAFVVFVVWSQFNDARAQVEREANELLDLARAARGFAPPLGDEVRRHVARYLEVVLDAEWRAMGRRDVAGFQPAWVVVEELWSVLRRAEPATKREEALYAEVLARFNDLSDARSARLASACTKIPLALRLLLWFGAIVTVASMYLFSVERLAVHAIMTAALAGAISHLMYVIEDLDDCFSGDWQVPRGALERVRVYVSAPAPAPALTATG